MPFGDAHTPSLALSLLQAELAEAGIPARSHYLNLAFAERIGLDRFDRYSLDMSGAFLGEWAFADCLFPRPDAEAERYVEEVLIPLEKFTLEEIASFEQDHAAAHPFLEESLRSHDWGRYRAIGFTTTFQQNTASLAFARMLKQAHPETAIVFGGANCEGEMGVQLLQSFPWIDYVCTGEGDDVFPQLALQLAGRGPRQAISGILGRPSNGGPAQLTHPAMVTDLDRLPFPTFSDYFDRVRETPKGLELRCRITLETSRGCWWGEKHHCTFCGLNGLSMKFRSKSPERAQREITHFSNRYKPLLHRRAGINFADNILDMNYFRSVLPALRETGLGTSLFYETKANLTRDQIQLLAESGVRDIQPGIESLHTDLLKLMRKGCTGLQNIQLLKWCRRFGITPVWNLLYGFPGEEPRWFDEQARTIDRITHLRPPYSIAPVRLDRFSPYYCEAGASGITNVRPARALSYIYALPESELSGMAYHFDFDYADRREPDRYVGAMKNAVERWRRLEMEAFFYALPWGDRLLFWDGRNGAEPEDWLLEPGKRLLYEYCDRVRGGSEIARFAGETLAMSEAQARTCLAEWVDAGAMIAEDDKYLGLAVLVDDGLETLDLDSGVETVPDKVGAAPQALDSLDRPRRASHMPWLATPEGTLLLDRSDGRLLVLAGAAAEIWAKADGERTVAALVDSDATGAGPGGVLAGLVAQGLILLDPAS